MRRAGEFLARFAWVLRRVIGVPDYETYLAHCRRAHPDSAPLTQSRFLSERLTARYAKPGSRCC